MKTLLERTELDVGLQPGQLRRSALAAAAHAGRLTLSIFFLETLVPILMQRHETALHVAAES